MSGCHKRLGKLFYLNFFLFNFMINLSNILYKYLNLFDEKILQIAVFFYVFSIPFYIIILNTSHTASYYIGIVLLLLFFANLSSRAIKSEISLGVLYNQINLWPLFIVATIFFIDVVIHKSNLFSQLHIQTISNLIIVYMIAIVIRYEKTSFFNTLSIFFITGQIITAVIYISQPAIKYIDFLTYVLPAAGQFCADEAGLYDGLQYCTNIEVTNSFAVFGRDPNGVAFGFFCALGASIYLLIQNLNKNRPIRCCSLFFAIQLMILGISYSSNRGSILGVFVFFLVLSVFFFFKKKQFKSILQISSFSLLVLFISSSSNNAFMKKFLDTDMINQVVMEKSDGVQKYRDDPLKLERSHIKYANKSKINPPSIKETALDRLHLSTRTIKQTNLPQPINSKYLKIYKQPEVQDQPKAIYQLEVQNQLEVQDQPKVIDQIEVQDSYKRYSDESIVLLNEITSQPEVNKNSIKKKELWRLRVLGIHKTPWYEKSIAIVKIPNQKTRKKSNPDLLNIDLVDKQDQIRGLSALMRFIPLEIVKNNGIVRYKRKDGTYFSTLPVRDSTFDLGGRWASWLFSYEVMQNNKLLGIGSDNFELVANFVSVLTPHNIFIHVLVMSGIIGFLVLLAPFIFALFKFKKFGIWSTGNNYMYLILCFGPPLALASLSLNIYNLKEWWLILAIMIGYWLKISDEYKESLSLKKLQINE